MDNHEKETKRPLDQEELTLDQEAKAVGGLQVNPSNFNTANLNPSNFNTANINPSNFNTSNINPACFNTANIDIPPKA